MNTTEILKIWAKTILIGSFLPSLIGLLAGPIGFFYLYLFFVIAAGLCLMPLLILMIIVFQKYTENYIIRNFYFIGSFITLLLLIGFLNFFEGLTPVGIIIIVLIYIYSMMISVLLTDEIKIS
jgi:hypothetical protein